MTVFWLEHVAPVGSRDPGVFSFRIDDEDGAPVGEKVRDDERDAFSRTRRRNRDQVLGWRANMQIAPDVGFSEQQKTPLHRRAGVPDRGVAPVSGLCTPVCGAKHIGHERTSL